MEWKREEEKGEEGGKDSVLCDVDGLIIESVNNVVETNDCFDDVAIGLCLRWSVEDDEGTSALVENAINLFVQNHLRQTPLNDVERKLNQ